MTRSQSQNQFKFRNRFQNPRRTQNYSEYFVRSNSFLSSYQYQDAYSSYQSFYRQFNARQYDRFEYRSQDNRNSFSDSRYFKKKLSEFVSVLSLAKQSLQITSENANQNASDFFSEIKSKKDRDNRYQRDYKSKNRVYVTKKDDHENEMKKSYNEKDDYYHESNSNLNYYNSQNQNDELETNFFTSSRTFDCRKCRTIFFFNNQLHKHIRQNICENFKFANHRFTKDKISNELTANLIMTISIVEFTVDFFKNIDTDFGFRD